MYVPPPPHNLTGGLLFAEDCARAHAVIVIGSICFIALIIGVVIFLVRSNGTLCAQLSTSQLVFRTALFADDNIVVIDKQGRKIKQKKIKPIGGAVGVPTNPAPDGLWHWYVAKRARTNLSTLMRLL
jgi:hypothetical protein